MLCVTRRPYPVVPVRPAGSVGWTTTREQFYYVVLAFYCFADGKAAVMEDEGRFVLISATTLLKMALFTAVLELTPALQTWHARGMKHVGVLSASRACALHIFKYTKRDGQPLPPRLLNELFPVLALPPGSRFLLGLSEI